MDETDLILLAFFTISACTLAAIVLLAPRTKGFRAKQLQSAAVTRGATERAVD